VYNVNSFMIKFSLKCECTAKFEGWFPSNEDYENQIALGQLLCPMCDSTQVRKDIMAPAVARSSTARTRGKESQRDGRGPDGDGRAGAETITATDPEPRWKKNFQDVGKNFAREARKAHKGKRDLEFYGNPSKEETNQLLDEGIDLFAGAQGLQGQLK
jgi:hypothetical protein